MFRQLLWTSDIFSLNKRLASFLPASNLLIKSGEITPEKMAINPLNGGVLLLPPENYLIENGFYGITSSDILVPAFFDFPEDEYEFLRKVEVYANIDGIYALFSSSEDVVYKTIYAPRTNYRIVGYYNNGLENTEKKTSKIYSGVEGDFGGFYVWSTIQESPLLTSNKQVSNTETFFYTGSITLNNDIFIDESPIIPSKTTFSNSNTFFFTAMLDNSDLPTQIESEIIESSILSSKTEYYIAPYTFSGSGVILN